jgi:hypothetical protein
LGSHGSQYACCSRQYNTTIKSYVWRYTRRNSSGVLEKFLFWKLNRSQYTLFLNLKSVRSYFLWADNTHTHTHIHRTLRMFVLAYCAWNTGSTAHSSIQQRLRGSWVNESHLSHSHPLITKLHSSLSIHTHTQRQLGCNFAIIYELINSRSAYSQRHNSMTKIERFVLLI